MTLSHLAFALLEWIALFLLLSPYFIWQRRKGKTWNEIIGGNVEPARMKRFISATRGALLVGVVLIGLVVAWLRWNYP
jgi:hypothetical protein